MSYKVLIADDEYTIREGLTSTIDWEDLGCELVGLAKDGEEAIVMLKQHRPDILLTDIKMPGKSGLEVAEAALALQPDIKLILISGYNEFEYAKQALQFGAVDFLLKPTVYEEVVHTLRSTVEAIEAHRRHNEELAKFKNEFMQQRDSLRQNLLRQLMSTSFHPPWNSAKLIERLRLYSLEEGSDLYVLLARVDRYEAVRSAHTEEEWQLLTMALSHHVSQYLNEGSGKYFVPIKEELFGVVIVDDGEDAVDLMQISHALQELVRRKFVRITLSIGISRRCASFLQLHHAYEEAEIALRHLFYLGAESTVRFEDLLWDAEPSTTSNQYAAYLEMLGPVVKSLQIGDESSAQRHLKTLFDAFVENREGEDSVKTVCIDLVSQLTQIGTSVARWSSERREQVYMNSLQCGTLNEYGDLLRGVIRELASEIYRKTRSQHRKIVEQVVAIIREHYHHDICLTWVAEQVHLNASYVSRLLKNELNESFTELLTKYRMEKAKEKLRDPQAKIYEVAEDVGMPDAHYFSVKFKRYTGMTPSEYRSNYCELF